MVLALLLWDVHFFKTLLIVLEVARLVIVEFELDLQEVLGL